MEEMKKSKVIEEYVKKRSQVVKTTCRKPYNVMRLIFGNTYLKRITSTKLER